MAEGEALLTKEKANKLLIQISNIEDENERIRSEAREQIKAFQSQEAQFQKEFESKSSALTNQIIQKDEKIKQLEKEIDRLFATFHGETNKNKLVKNDDNRIKEKLLLDISARGSLHEKELAATTGVHKIKAEKLADELVSKKLLSNTKSTTGNRYEVTQEGKNFIISENLYDKH